jgi:hypothetical protein
MTRLVEQIAAVKRAIQDVESLEREYGNRGTFERDLSGLRAALATLEAAGAWAADLNDAWFRFDTKAVLLTPEVALYWAIRGEE